MKPGIITTPEGREIDLTALTPADYVLSEVATALSHIARWGGRSYRPISVASHALRVAALVQLCGGSRIETLIALHHDDTEAFGLGDVCHPLKALFPALQQWEASVWAECIAPALGLPIEIPELVHQADRAIGEFENASRGSFLGISRMITRTTPSDMYLTVHSQLTHHGHCAQLDTYARDLRLTPDMIHQPTPSYV
jgi:hypothetical protein